MNKEKATVECKAIMKKYMKELIELGYSEEDAKVSAKELIEELLADVKEKKAEEIANQNK
jgi:hypothetical protein